MTPQLPNHLIIRKEISKSDWKLQKMDGARNNGRKFLVNSIFPKTECLAEDPEWKPSSTPEEKTPVIPTGKGGIEISTFNENADQDCHKHLKGTEIYSVIEGSMKIRLNESEIVTLKAGDDVVVLPGTIHEVLYDETSKYLTRVYSIDCFGNDDKFVKVDGNWVNSTGQQKI